MSLKYISSNELFHFVGHNSPTDHEANYQILLAVLDAGCVSHPPHTRDWGAHRITINWEENIFSEKLIVPTVTCYCDIPLESLEIHVKKYGAFGLSFPRSLLIKYGARPVFYIPNQPSDPVAGWGTIHCEAMLHDIEQIWRGFREHVVDPLNTNSFSHSMGVKPTSKDQAALAMNDAFQHFMAYIKPFNSELIDDDLNNFYFEREWRKFGNLLFQPGDVIRVVTAPDYFERLKRDRPSYADKVAVASV